MNTAIAIAEAVFARQHRAPPAERLIWLRSELEDFLARAGTRTRLMLSLLLWLVALIAPLVSGRVARFKSLNLPEREEALAKLEQRIPEPLLAVKAVLCLLYYEHPDAAREVGVHAPQFVAERVS